MAQTKRKRRTKHRGNAAGMVEVRGRTGRSSTPAASKANDKDARRAARMERINRPPTWQSAINRAAFAAIGFMVLVVLLLKQPVAQAVALGAFMLLIYIPLGYYTDKAIYSRRQKLLGRGSQRKG